MGEIIVGVDGSDSSRTAVRWAARTASARGSQLRAVAAWQYPARAATPVGPAELLAPDDMDQQTRQDLAALIREELEAAADGVILDVGRGPAATVLRDIADRTDADMLVLGARGLGGFAGLLLGSVSQQCVEYGRCPIVVLRGDRNLADGPIVIGLDGSDGAARALEWTIDLADATGVSIVAVHAPVLGANNAMMDAARQALEQWCAPIRDRSVPHEMRIEPGDPRTALEDVADAVDASLLVVGTRGLGAVRGLLLGSVAGYVARYSVRPSAIVPDPAR